MTRRLQENILVAILIAVLVAVIWESFNFGPRARLVPIPIATIGILLLLFQLYWQNSRPADDLNIDVFEFLTGRKEDTVEDLLATGKTKSRTDPATLRRREWTGLAMVVALIISCMLVGPIPTSIVFGLIYFRALASYSWRNTVLITIALTGSIWILFGELLGVQLDRTIFGYGLMYMLVLQ
ncbi:tripartite tricarboxylate transporter TctB family protein [Pseudoxanthobacter sp. M-2]|uniref:tripartite tricarboxylate transporter TctB family protein n=1 Tax=Pseudoxanthobacter sp. M-2 TaxID=3078754 RepID=UPI0038FC3A99